VKRRFLPGLKAGSPRRDSDENVVLASPASGRITDSRVHDRRRSQDHDATLRMEETGRLETAFSGHPGRLLRF
jgi:hypothetical protein